MACGLLLLTAGALAQQQLTPNMNPQQMVFPRQKQAFRNDNEFYEQAYHQHDQAGAAREAAAQANFDALIIPQNAPPQNLQINAAPAKGVLAPTSGVAPAAEARIPLNVYEQIRKQLNRLQRRQARKQGPAVILGSADYRGQARKGGLHLRLRLQVTLGREGVWKTVPLLGQEVALVSATVDGQPARLSRRAGFHVWVTRRTGEATVVVDFLVPARGPRGSVEYDFIVARTPVTRFQCTFPVAGLQPRLDAAVQSEVHGQGRNTILTATLRPTTRIHLVGFRDLGEAEQQQARVYAESLNLLSVDEGALDVFTVVRYTILYAGTKQFLVQIPPDLTVVAADGEGAFRYQLETNEQGTLLRGETAFPIRNNYEISLRLHRELSPVASSSFVVPLPRCLEVEREHGWLGVEVPGKLLLEQEQVEQVLAIDARQLPEEMVRSSVSPILRAYSYHSPRARVTLRATRLPEKEPESGSIDRIRAITTLTGGGRIMTDLRITLRNRLRHSLALRLEEGSRVLSTHLDGQKVKPSRDEQGRLLLPLKRSAGRERLQAFTISVVLERQDDSLGILGRYALQLPAVDLPVSSLAWSIHAPARNIYTSPEGDIDPQEYAGRAGWHAAVAGHAAGWGGGRGEADGGVLGLLSEAGPVASAHSGAMPVRIKIPAHGKKLGYQRYWLEKGRPVRITFWHARGWLRLPAWWTLAGLLALGIMMLSLAFGKQRRALPAAGGLVLAMLVCWPLLRLGGALGVVLGVLGGVALTFWQRHWLRRAPTHLLEWARTLPARYRQRRHNPAAWTGPRVAWRMVLAIGICYFALVLLDAFFQVAVLMLL